MSVLTLNNVSVTYPDGVNTDGTPRTVTALADASLAADAGTVTALVGPSGSGKSTLLSVIAGLVKPTQGDVVVDGINVSELDEEGRTTLRRERVGIVFQQPNLLPALTAAEQLELNAHLSGASRQELKAAKARALELLERVGLADQANRRPHQLSGGQRQRINIARALMNKPAVLLADEPTSALDHERAKAIIELLTDVTREQGLATLIVTHDLEIADSADRIIKVRDGHLQAVEAEPEVAPRHAIEDDEELAA